MVEGMLNHSLAKNLADLFLRAKGIKDTKKVSSFQALKQACNDSSQDIDPMLLQLFAQMIDWGTVQTWSETVAILGYVPTSEGGK